MEAQNDSRGSADGPVWRCRDRVLRPAARPLIMGIVNVTPDSFSDGGRRAAAPDAVAHALRLAEAGADILDVGGESTRPGAAPVSVDRELARVMPVFEALGRRGDLVLSVDTAKSEVAGAALAAGARLVNDVSALTADARMAGVARKFGAGVILMHRRGDSRTMQQLACYGDVAGEVLAYLAERLEAAERLGLARETLAVDPGIGFAKTAEHNVALLARLQRLAGLGRPVVVGLSRKAFLGRLTGRDVGERLAGTLGALAFCLGEGAHVLLVHDVAETRDVVRVVGALLEEKRRVEPR